MELKLKINNLQNISIKLKNGMKINHEESWYRKFLILYLYLNGYNKKKIAEKMKIHYSNISLIINHSIYQIQDDLRKYIIKQNRIFLSKEENIYIDILNTPGYVIEKKIDLYKNRLKDIIRKYDNFEKQLPQLIQKYLT